MPVQALLDAGSTCVCEERGFCPRNPDGPCQCDHDHSSGEQQAQTSDDSDAPPILQSCEGHQPTAIGSISPYKWLVPVSGPVTTPVFSTVSYERVPRDLSSQQAGDDIFHPPRPAAA